MTAADLAIVGLYMAAMVALSGWLARGQTQSTDYYLGGRSLPWWALGVSTLATQSSANSFIGIPAFVALVPGGGLTWLQYELALPLATLLVMLLFVPVFRGLGIVSIYEYLERRFDRPTRLLLSAVFLVSRALASGVALYAAAVVIQVCTGLPLVICVLALGFVTVVYDMLGGMRAVVWTDVLQMLLMVGGVGVAIAFAVSAVGGVDAVLAAVEPARLAAVDPGHGLGDRAAAPLWGFVVGGFVLYVAYYGVDQSQVQRQLAAGSVHDAQKLLLVNGLVRLPLTLLYAALGLALAALWQSSPALRAAVPAARLDFLVPRFIELHLPVGVRGLLVAAILAAAMSSLDSALNSLSAATMRDFLARRVTPQRQLVVSRLCTLFWGVVITAVGLRAGDLAPSVVEAINRVGALFYGPLLAAFVCGICDPRSRGAAVRCGVTAGLAANVLLWALLGPALFWMWWNVTGLVVAGGVTVLLSRLMPATVATTPELRWQRGAWSRLPRGSIALLATWTLLTAGLLGWLGSR